MSTKRPHLRSGHRSGLGLVVAALLGLVMAVLAPVSQAVTPPPTADAILLTNIFTPSIETAPNAPWAKPPFVVQDIAFTTEVSFTFQGSPAPLSWSKDTTVTLTETVGPQAGKTINSFKVPMGATSALIPGSILKPASNNVTLQAKAGNGSNALVGTRSFNVLQTATGVNNGTTTLLSVGGTGSGAGVPCSATAAKPWCTDVILPSADSVLDNRLVVAQGTCVGLAGSGDDPLLCAKPDLSYSTAIFDVNPAKVTRTTPITVLVKCDKTVCAGDPKNYPVQVKLTPTDPWTTPAFCTKQGQIDPGLLYCWDLQNSIKNGAGDLIQALQFLTDPSISPKH